MRCCSQFPCINITDHETDDKNLSPSPSIRFHIYYLVARCTQHGRIPLTDKKSCRECQQDTALGQPTKKYTEKELMMVETSFSNFNTSFFIPEIHKVVFHIPHVQLMGKNHCGDSCQTVFKRRESFQDVLCRRDYAGRVVASFATKYNHNIMEETDLCLLRVLHWNISVH